MTQNDMTQNDLADLMQDVFHDEAMALEHFDRVATALGYDGPGRLRLRNFITHVFNDEIMALRAAGQKEYAHDPDEAFANFMRVGGDVSIDRKHVCWIFAMKHRDGIASWLAGHQSQREDVRGRINDLIVYLFILRGMIEEETVDTANSRGG